MIEWVVFGAYVLLRQMLKTTVPPERPVVLPPESVVVFAGAASSGKSSTINALVDFPACAVGSEHGTTTTIQNVPFQHGYALRDLPGYMDNVGNAGWFTNQAHLAEIVVYVCAGQLYRPELDFLRVLHARQALSNQLRMGRRRRLVVFCNKRDVAEAVSTETERMREMAALQRQIDEVAPNTPLVFGSARPRCSRPDVETLRHLLLSSIFERGA